MIYYINMSEQDIKAKQSTSDKIWEAFKSISAILVIIYIAIKLLALFSSNKSYLITTDEVNKNIGATLGEFCENYSSKTNLYLILIDKDLMPSKTSCAIATEYEKENYKIKNSYMEKSDLKSEEYQACIDLAAVDCIPPIYVEVYERTDFNFIKPYKLPPLYFLVLFSGWADP